MKIRTLVVDDEYLIVKSLVHILTSMKEQFEVVGTGTDGEMAYDLICSLSPELVLLDISMPRLDGLHLLQKLHDNAIPIPTIVILSAYRNFSYAQQALHYGCKEYLVKPFVRRELVEQLSNLADQIQQQRPASPDDQRALLPELLSSRLSALLAGAQDNAFPDFLASHSLSGFPARLCIAHRPEGWSQLPLMVQRFSHQLPQSTGIFCFALNGRPAFWMHANYGSLQADGLAQAIREIGGSHCILGISNPISDVSHLSSCDKTITRSLCRMFYSHELTSPLLYVCQEPLPFSPLPRFPLHDGFSAALQQHNTADVLHILQEYFFTLNHEQCFAPSDIYKTVYDCVVYLRSLPEPLFPSLCDRLKRIELKNIAEYQTLDDLFLFFYQLVLDIVEDLRTAADTGDHCIMLAQNYCRTHLTIVTMADTAAYVHMSKNYFCRYFKQHTGKTFSDYLTALRMQTAKDFLHSTNLRVSDIAARIGYGTTSHFISVFKSACGVTPTEYRTKAFAQASHNLF